ncbi:putative palmitoyltransferase ZDHHC14 [Nymphon striatum]|nr:putative palmitoyltransferase ZDHHC14 [Nymphon striatum]
MKKDLSQFSVTSSNASSPSHKSADSLIDRGFHEKGWTMPYVTRKWQTFPGRNKFYCNGRIMMARQTGIFYFTVCLIIGTCGLFFAFDQEALLIGALNLLYFTNFVAAEFYFLPNRCPFLTENVSPLFPVVGGLLFIFVISSLLRTSFSDPGVIPRATADEAADIERQIEVPNGTSTPSYRPPPRTKEIQVKGQTVKLKFCFTCKIFRPPRASHCSLCDNCVVEGVVCFFSIWSIVGLAGFHSYLVFSNQTTNEDIKGSFSSKRGQDTFNPYSQGSVISNCAVVLCTPNPPSLIDSRGAVVPENNAQVPESREALNRRDHYGTVKTQKHPSVEHVNETNAHSPSIYNNGQSLNGGTASAGHNGIHGSVTGTKLMSMTTRAVNGGYQTALTQPNAYNNFISNSNKLPSPHGNNPGKDEVAHKVAELNWKNMQEILNILLKQSLPLVKN